MSAIVRNADQMSLQTFEIDPTRLANVFSIAHLTATDNFELTPPQVDALKRYLTIPAACCCLMRLRRFGHRATGIRESDAARCHRNA